MPFVLIRTWDGKTLAHTVTRIEKNTPNFLMTDWGQMTVCCLCCQGLVGHNGKQPAKEGKSILVLTLLLTFMGCLLLLLM